MDCLVCQEDITRTGYGVNLECGHIFHGKCILEWMDSSTTCPACRTDFCKNTIHHLYLTVPKNDENYKFEIERSDESEKEEIELKFLNNPVPSNQDDFIPIEIQRNVIVSDSSRWASEVGFIICFVVFMVFIFVAVPWTINKLRWG